MVCTGNINRSPMGEALLRDRLAARGVDALVASAGTQATLGAASPHVVDVLAASGVDVTSHRSRQLNPELVETVDVVLGMAREHVREVAVLQPALFRRAFTLKEIVRRGGEVGRRRPDEPLAEWLARVGEGRTAQMLLGADPVDDVADPIGGSRQDYERTAAQITELVDAFVDLACPRPPAERTRSGLLGGDLFADPA